jgi:hypothetical protein
VIVHRIFAGAENGVGWIAMAVLVVLTALSYLLDFFAGLVGAKRFGATRWGVIGAIIGGILGIFTGFITLLVLPIAGAVIGEMIGGKRLVDAGKAGWGTLLGNVAGMIGKLALGLAMVVVFLMNTRAPGLG